MPRQRLNGDNYEVEAILNHRIRTTDKALLFKIKWLGYSERRSTYEPAKMLCGSKDLVDAYLESLDSATSSQLLKYRHEWNKRMKENHHDEQDQDQDSENSNPNYVSLDTILVYVDSYMASRNNPLNLMVEQYVDWFDEEQDKLYILEHLQHYYVLLWHSKQVYLVDGANLSLETGYRRKVEKLIGAKVVPLTVLHTQSQTGQCGSSAITICLELIRLLTSNEFSVDKPIKETRGLRDQLVAKLHPVREEFLQPKRPINELMKEIRDTNKCDICETTFKSRRALSLHKSRSHK